LVRKALSAGTKQVTVPAEEAPANSVPAAAVIRGGRALFGITGRKGRVGGPHKSAVKTPGLTGGRPWKLSGWRTGEGGGIPGVAVKCVEIGRNTGGEGGRLDRP
jgi:hypothetical protein